MKLKQYKCDCVFKRRLFKKFCRMWAWKSDHILAVIPYDILSYFPFLKNKRKLYFSSGLTDSISKEAISPDIQIVYYLHK